MRQKPIKYVTFRRCHLRRSKFNARRFHRLDCIAVFRVVHNNGHVRGSTLEPISVVVIRTTYFLNARCIRFLLLPRRISTLLGRQPVRGRRAAGRSVASGCASFCRSVDPHSGLSLPRHCRAPSARAFGAGGKRPQTPARRVRIRYPRADRRRMPSIPHRADASAIVACVSERFFTPAYVDQPTRLRHVSRIPRRGGRPQRKPLFRERRSRRLAALIGPAPITACRGPSLPERVRR